MQASALGDTDKRTGAIELKLASKHGVERAAETTVKNLAREVILAVQTDGKILLEQFAQEAELEIEI